MSSKIVFAGGGTAGHVMPGIAVAEALLSRGVSKNDLVFRGARGSVETPLVRSRGFSFLGFPSRGLRRRISIENAGWNLIALVEVVLSTAQTLISFLVKRPLMVVVIGGHAAASSVFASTVLRIPMVVIQVDSHVGVVNSLAARRARVVAVPNQNVKAGNSIVTGVPVRHEICAIERSDDSRAIAKKALSLPQDRALIVAMGGSLGSQKINDSVKELAKLWRARTDVSVLLISGTRQSSSGELVSEGIVFSSMDFTNDLKTVYEAADVIVSRAGANSVAEIGVLAIPAVLIPLPGSPGDHQRKNAEMLTATGGAVFLSDADCSGTALAEILEPMCDEATRMEMTSKLKSLPGRDAAEAVAKLIIKESGVQHGIA